MAGNKCAAGKIVKAFAAGIVGRWEQTREQVSRRRKVSRNEKKMKPLAPAREDARK
jgi:hypothetical protein